MKNMWERSPRYDGSFVYRGAEKFGARFSYFGIEPTDGVEVIPTSQWCDNVLVEIQALEDFVDAVRAARQVKP